MSKDKGPAIPFPYSTATKSTDPEEYPSPWKNGYYYIASQMEILNKELAEKDKIIAELKSKDQMLGGK